MILADKIIEERKRIGLSQEELAEKLNVSRQSVSKWEGAQSIPDINRIIMLAEIFGVTTDYLLKDDAVRDAGDSVKESAEHPRNARKLSLEEANQFIRTREKYAPKIAFGVMLCIWSPIAIILLGGLQEDKIINISENAVGGLGTIFLILMIAAAVALFIRSGSKLGEFKYLENEEFETAYGVDGMVKEKKEVYAPSHTSFLIAGVVLCILSIMPMFIALCFTERDVVMIAMVALLLFIVGIAVNMIVCTILIKDSYDMLLQNNEYSISKKRRRKKLGVLEQLYWLVITAIYFILSFLTGAWDITWIIWVAAGIFAGIVNIFFDNKNE